VAGADRVIRLRALGAVELQRDDGAEVGSVTAQAKRLALLVYLAAARPHGFHRRDKLVGLSWPESPDSRARGALGQALFFLRRSLGNDVVVSRGHDELAVAADRLWCDAAAVHGALEGRTRRGRARALSRRPAVWIFPGGCARVRREGLDRERAHLQSAVLEAASAGAAELEQSDPDSAVALPRRAIEIAPENERALCRLMQLLNGRGDRAGALAVVDTLARRLLAELDIEPSPETVRVRDGIVARAAPRANC
jgi:DNA-binding SARP family transcriptional activator